MNHDARLLRCLTAIASIWIAGAAAVGDEIRFNRDIRPLLTENCFECHGPDAASREADLRLDSREVAVETGAIVPGDAGSSELIARIRSDDAELQMPPKDSGKQLSKSEIQLLADWIDSGAEFERHWAFIPPQRPDLPAPKGVADWARNPIDHFVLASLHERGLTPNEEGDPYTLARRAAFDLTGLPPEFNDVTQLHREGASDYESYVQSLAASQHAGEHRARFWLDAARYGDTHGMHVDNYREIWPYRDWVIDAFNDNMPFDEFLVEQLAGDLLPNPTSQQLIATGFNRCNITTSEGGAISEEVNVRYMVDRVETTATVFLGLTAGCAVCHDHKYDPISQREFYRLGAFFNNTTQPAMDGNQRDTPPVLTLPKQEFASEWEKLMARRESLRDDLDQIDATKDWWPALDRPVEHPISDDGLILWLPLTKSNGDNRPTQASWATEHPSGQRGMRFGADSQWTVDLPKLRTDEPLTISFWFRTPDQVMESTLFDHTTVITEPEPTPAKKTKPKQQDGAPDAKQEPKPKRTTVGWKVTHNVRSELIFEIFDRNGNKIRAPQPDNDALVPRTWQHCCIRYSGGQSQSSVTLLVDGRVIAIRRGTETFLDATDLAETPLKIASRLPTSGLSDIRIYRRWVSDREAQLLSNDYRVLDLLNSDREWQSLEQDDRHELHAYHRVAVNLDHRRLSRELADSQRRRDYIYSRSTTTLVMEERETAPRAWVLSRGQYDLREEEVSPGVPAMLPPLPKDMDADRLALARWLVDPQHPLTARVMVNRLWQSIFGVGLVKTSEDFGVMGDPPSHPELLDWLAVEFIESGWNVRHLLQLMVNSATYRQSERVTGDKLAADPDNRWLSRAPRLRLDAEALRDQALAVSGLLRSEVGGPSVRPYQPPGLWNVVAIVGSNTGRFKQDSGDALYRRSLYTFWKRTSPPPSMAAFNAPTREQCTVRRERTNTPLQALVLMNDPQFVEAARHLAQRAMLQGDQDDHRAGWMLTEALRRPADQADIDDLVAAAVEFRKIFREDTQQARQLIETGDSEPDNTLDAAELATWTLVANTIMNRDDFISK